MSVAAKTKIITRATSLGGVESLIGASSIDSREQEQLHLKACCDCPSVCENADDLIEDRDQALG